MSSIDQCALNDFGVLLSFHSTLPGRSDTACKEIREQYEKYRKHTRECISLYEKIESPEAATKEYKNALAEFDQLYYPFYYYLFGQFDLAAVSLVDSFLLASQLGIPSAASLQVTMHGVPIVEADKTQKKFLRSPQKLYSFTPESPATGRPATMPLCRSYPLIGISKLKVNPVLLLASGAGIVRKIIQALPGRIQNVLQETGKPQPQITILESLGWTELTLIIHAYNFTDVSHVILAVRELRLSDILPSTPEFSDPENQLIKAFYQTSLTEPAAGLINAFSASWSTMGMDTELYHWLEDRPQRHAFGYPSMTKAQADELLGAISGRLLADIGFNTIPGHLRNLADVLSEYEKNLTGPVTDLSTETAGAAVNQPTAPKKQWFLLSRPGKSDLAWRISCGLEKPHTAQGTVDFSCQRPFIETGAFLREMVEIDKQVNPPHGGDGPAPRPMIYRYNTSLAIPVDLEAFSFAAPAPSMLQNLQALQIRDLFVDRSQEPPVDRFRKNLRRLQLPRHLMSELYSLIDVYDALICDPVLFDSVVELGPSMIALMYQLMTCASYPPDVENQTENLYTVLLNELTHSLQNLRAGLSNRYNASLPLTELSDITLEFKGGIQHLLTSIDGMIASVLSALSDPNSIHKAWRKLTGFSVIGEYRQGHIDILPIGAVVHHNVIEMMQPEWLVNCYHEAFHYLIRLPDLKSLHMLLNYYDFMIDATIRSKKYWQAYRDGKPLQQFQHYLDDFLFSDFDVAGYHNALVEEIAADQMCRDIGFGTGGEVLHRQWYGLVYASISNYSRFHKGDYREFCLKQILRYLLTLDRAPTQEEALTPERLRLFYQSEIHQCSEWLQDTKPNADGREPGLVKRLDEGDDELWHDLWEWFFVLYSVPNDAWQDKLGEDIRKTLAELATTNQAFLPLSIQARQGRLPKTIEVLQVVRQVLWGLLQGESAEGVTARSLIPQDGFVAAFRPPAGPPEDRRRHDELLYIREVMNTYLKYIFGQTRSIGVVEKSETGKYLYPPGTPALLVDPAGGTHSPSVYFRRRYFQAAITCMFSLWDLGLYQKHNKICKMLDILNASRGRE